MKIILKESGLPIYEQIIQAIKNEILNESLSPGDMLPSIRTLAKELNISVITTKRAYEELEKQGLIYSRQGKGFYINRPNHEVLREEQLKNLEKNLADCIEKGKECGLTLKKFQKIIDILWERRE